MYIENDKIEDVSEWYLEQCIIQEKKAKTHSSYLFGGIKLLQYFIKIFLVMLLLQLAINLWISFDERQSSSSVYSFFTIGFIIILIYSTIAWVIFLLSWEKINSFELMIKNEKVFLIPENKGKDLKLAIKELADNMRINYSLISFWSIINRDKYPSIEEDKSGNINMLLPINFISFFTKNREGGISILAHELGHVLQKDTKLYLTTDAYFEIIRKIYLPVSILNLLIHVWVIFSSNNVSKIFNSDLTSFIVGSILVWDVILISYLYNGFISLRETRRTSEKLADTAAVIFANGRSLQEILESMPNTSGSSKATSIHPNNMERIENIKFILNLNSNVNPQNSL
jgi:Peptidase family M48